ncbi:MULTISPECIES: hypothetical protein [Pseudoalteromonas]|uniref:Uncharacterized protein n=1 Tax=Pseudoalteromonas amylolytica TaxID=1859457 RepID=A0A1S1MWY9_9GAMM|nr:MULTISPECIES: hypothetical protein [Pseudoalteromonas]OHU85509.1 hypothetical protein BFC16_19365 [Pseudoalteromonas sp. JW3]OHU91743.1 hypothetical protein BET10_08060 [Pseudoalteromonas amylolytica]
MVLDTVQSVDVQKVYVRLYMLFNVDSDAGLSRALGLSASAVRNARNRNSLPWEGVINGCISHGIDLNEVFTGSALKVNNDKEKPSDNNDTERLAVTDVLAAHKLVVEVLDDILTNKHLNAERELLVRNKLTPLLLEKVFEYNFNEVMVKTVAEGALYMT